METPDVQTPAHLSQSLSTNPLFSTIFTLYALILLYFPSLFLRLFLSPVPIITALLLLTLLRLGSSPENSNLAITLSENANCANENKNKNENENEDATSTDTLSEKEPLLELDSKWVIARLQYGSSHDQNKEERNRVVPLPENESVGESDSVSGRGAVLEDRLKWVVAEKEYCQSRDLENEHPNRVVVRPEDGLTIEDMKSDTGSRKESVLGNDSIWVVGRRRSEPGTEVGFVGWDVKAPLGVIYEEYEGQEEEDPDKEEKLEIGSCLYPSISFSDVDSESGLSSDGELPETGEWSWPDGINLGFERDPDPVGKEELIEIELGLESEYLGFHLEEENLIEIDIFSHKRKCEFIVEKMAVP